MKKNWQHPSFEISQFFENFDTGPPRSMHDFFEVNLMWTFRDVLKYLLPYGHVNEKKKMLKNFKK